VVSGLAAYQSALGNEEGSGTQSANRRLNRHRPGGGDLGHSSCMWYQGLGQLEDLDLSNTLFTHSKQLLLG
jgi:hypothetical protein